MEARLPISFHIEVLKTTKLICYCNISSLRLSHVTIYLTALNTSDTRKYRDKHNKYIPLTIRHTWCPTRFLSLAANYHTPPVNPTFLVPVPAHQFALNSSFSSLIECHSSNSIDHQSRPALSKLFFGSQSDLMQILRAPHDGEWIWAIQKWLRQ